MNSSTLSTARIVLFDIDGTLVSTQGAGRRALTRALINVIGHPSGTWLSFSLAGMTDRAIVKHAFAEQGYEEPSEDTIERIFSEYLDCLNDELNALHHDIALTGARELIATLGEKKADQIEFGLGTGNIRNGAFAKLNHAGLAKYFSFGGYGSDAETRAELLDIAAFRGASQMNITRQSCRVIVVGDTPNDVAAAAAIGATSVAVATGPYSGKELDEAGATIVVDNLLDERLLDHIVAMES